MSRQGFLLDSKSIKIRNTEEVGSKRIRYTEVAFVMKGFRTLDIGKNYVMLKSYIYVASKIHNK